MSNLSSLSTRSEKLTGTAFLPDPMKGTEKVLLVDDEQIITDLGRQILEKLGYDVLTAGSGETALELFGQHKDTIEAVILDMFMPDMSGSETYARMKEISPRVKVILSSGYRSRHVSDILDQGGVRFLSKPYSLAQFAQTLRETLDRQS